MAYFPEDDHNIMCFTNNVDDVENIGDKKFEEGFLQNSERPVDQL